MAILKRGSKGSEVRLLQKGLAIFGKTVDNITSFDGDFGPKTELAVKKFQSENRLPVTGVYDEDTQAILGPKIDFMFIRHADMAPYAREMRVELAALQAVYTVESKADGFYHNGLPVILFEGHIFYKLLKRDYGLKKAEDVARMYPRVCYPTWTKKYYLGGILEHTRLNTARLMDKDLADQSASWGIFQIMGFNHKTAGFNTIRSYINGMYESEHKQFEAGCNFISANAAMLKALRDKNWTTFAKLYNGSGYAQNQYHTKLANAYKKLKE